MIGVDGSRSNIDNSDKLVILGQETGSVKHRGHRPSQHAAFWRYLHHKATGLGVTIVGLKEFNSSKVCRKCCQRIDHDPAKHHRVYYCSHCEIHAHRDDSSSDIHCNIGWLEVIGVKEAMERNERPDLNSIIRYRSRIFMTKWMLKDRHEQEQKRLQQRRLLQQDEQQPLEQQNQQQELNEPQDGNELDPLAKGSAATQMQRTTE